MLFGEIYVAVSRWIFPFRLHAQKYIKLNDICGKMAITKKGHFSQCSSLWYVFKGGHTHPPKVLSVVE